jgi:hypothetical protein
MEYLQSITNLYELPSFDDLPVRILKTDTRNKHSHCCQQPDRRPHCACPRLVAAALCAAENAEVFIFASVTDVHTQATLNVCVFKPTWPQAAFSLETEAILGCNRYKLF